MTVHFGLNSNKSMDGLIWVVDSADRDRLKESHVELMNLLQCDLIRGQIPILLFANKQDTKHALYPSDVARFLEFHRISTKETISIHPGFACSLILKLKKPQSFQCFQNSMFSTSLELLGEVLSNFHEFINVEIDNRNLFMVLVQFQAKV